MVRWSRQGARWILVAVGMLLPMSAWGQSPLTPADYGQWERLGGFQMDPSGLQNTVFVLHLPARSRSCTKSHMYISGLGVSPSSSHSQ